MNERKIEAIAKASFEENCDRAWGDTTERARESRRIIVRDVLTGALTLRADWLEASVRRHAAVWDAALSAAEDAVAVVREGLGCEESAGASSALRTVRALRSDANNSSR